MEYYTAMLVQEAEKLYNKLVKDLVNRAIDDEVFSRSSTLSSRQQQQPSSWTLKVDGVAHSRAGYRVIVRLLF